MAHSESPNDRQADSPCRISSAVLYMVAGRATRSNVLEPAVRSVVLVQIVIVILLVILIRVPSIPYEEGAFPTRCYERPLCVFTGEVHSHIIREGHWRNAFCVKLLLLPRMGYELAGPLRG